MKELDKAGWKSCGTVFLLLRISKLNRALREHLTLTEKQKLHQQIAELLTRELPDNRESAEVIASHLLNVPLDLDGCRLLLKAADTARNNRLFIKALSCYKKVIDDIAVIEGPTGRFALHRGDSQTC